MLDNILAKTAYVATLIFCIMCVVLVWDNSAWWDDIYVRIFLTDVVVMVSSLITLAINKLHGVKNEGY